MSKKTAVSAILEANNPNNEKLALKKTHRRILQSIMQRY
jgi:hypothetical protein